MLHLEDGSGVRTRTWTVWRPPLSPPAGVAPFSGAVVPGHSCSGGRGRVASGRSLTRIPGSEWDTARPPGRRHRPRAAAGSSVVLADLPGQVPGLEARFPELFTAGPDPDSFVRPTAATGQPGHLATPTATTPAAVPPAPRPGIANFSGMITAITVKSILFVTTITNHSGHCRVPANFRYAACAMAGAEVGHFGR